MPGLPRSEYVSLTTFRRTGAPVPTPVWAAPDGESLVVWTRADSGKVKRLRHTPRVTVAPCDFRGRVLGDTADGLAELIPAAERSSALEALRRTYGLRFTVGDATARLWHRVLRRPGERHELIRIRPVS